PVDRLGARRVPDAAGDQFGMGPGHRAAARGRDAGSGDLGDVEPDIADATAGACSSRATASVRSDALIAKCGASGAKNSNAVKFAFISPDEVCVFMASR